MKKMLFPDKGIARNLAICTLIGSFCVTGKAEIVINNPPLASEISASGEEWVPISDNRQGSAEWVPIAKPMEEQQGAATTEAQEERTTRKTVYSLESAYNDYKRGDYTNAYAAFNHYAGMNDMHAILAIGYLLFHGNIAPNYAKAATYLERAEQAGFARAYYLRGLLERAKSNNSRQFNLVAERLLNKAANMGDAPAANALANQYFYRGNMTEAKRWNEKANQLGSRAAKKNQHTISSGNTKLIAASSTNNDALAQLRKSSAEGNAQATYELATRYHKGVGVNVNFGEAIRLYRVAAGQGSDAARKILPVLLSRQSSTGGINSMWMQETSNMVAMPPIILTDKEKENKSGSAYPAGTARQQVSLAEDDPLDNLLNLVPSSLPN